jgi:hypothetical protein
MVLEECYAEELCTGRPGAVLACESSASSAKQAVLR